MHYSVPRSPEDIPYGQFLHAGWTKKASLSIQRYASSQYSNPIIVDVYSTIFFDYHSCPTFGSFQHLLALILKGANRKASEQIQFNPSP